MSQYINDAIELLKETSAKLGMYVDQYADGPSDDDTWEKAHCLYQIAAELQVQASQLGECSGSIEGHCHINNARSTVSVGDYEIRGDIQFEIQKDGKWIKGHRSNSEYGQVFIGHDGSSTIMTEGMIGRITQPLKMDR